MIFVTVLVNLFNEYSQNFRVFQKIFNNLVKSPEIVPLDWWFEFPERGF